MYIYRLFDEDKNLLYVGRTVNDAKTRVKAHIKKGFRRDIEWRMGVRFYDFMEVANEADLILYEVYCINKFDTPHNKEFKVDSSPTVTMDLDFSRKMNVSSLNLEINKKKLKKARRKRQEYLKNKNVESEAFRRAVENLYD